jgi:hypothetical protein
MGPVALFLLLFYAIFFGVGFAMIWATIDALSVEEIELTGRSLVIKKTIGKWVRTNVIELDPETRAVVGVAQTGIRSENKNVPQRAVLMTDAKGKEMVRFDLSGGEGYAEARSLHFAELIRTTSDWQFEAIGVPSQEDSFTHWLKAYM